MTKIKIIEAYKDLELKRTVKQNEILEVSDARAKELVKKKIAIIIPSKKEEQE